MSTQDDEFLLSAAEEETPELDEAERKYEQAAKIVRQNPVYRRVMLQVLSLCSDGCARKLEDLEKFVAAQPDMEGRSQPPYFPIKWLEQSYALEEKYFDGEGNLYTWDDVKDLTEDEFDDLVESLAYETSEIGMQVLEEFEPTKWVKELFNEGPNRQEVYIEIMDYARERRSLAEIDHHIRPSERFSLVERKTDKITPGMFVDKLKAVGALYYDHGWLTTEEGDRLLKEMGR